MKIDKELSKNLTIKHGFPVKMGEKMTGGGGVEKLQKFVYEEYLKNGYKKMFAECSNRELADIAELGLIDTEVSEAIECIRHGKNQLDLSFELADIVIRAMNFASRKGININNAILQKHKKNMKRGYLHGKVV